MKRLLDENSFCVALWPVSRAFHPGCWLNKMHQHFEFCNVATGWGCLLFMLAEGNKFVPTYIQTWKKNSTTSTLFNYRKTCNFYTLSFIIYSSMIFIKKGRILNFVEIKNRKLEFELCFIVYLPLKQIIVYYFIQQNRNSLCTRHFENIFWFCTLWNICIHFEVSISYIENSCKQWDIRLVK